MLPAGKQLHVRQAPLPRPDAVSQGLPGSTLTNIVRHVWAIHQATMRSPNGGPHMHDVGRPITGSASLVTNPALATKACEHQELFSTNHCF
jgi:hypothetical protein